MMRKGFTMIELLVVMSIMAFLGVAATNGYALLSRGMRERSAVAAASALLKSAKERADIDQSKVVVYCYNRLIADNENGKEGNAIVVGVMTAIRRGGRLSRVDGEYLYDEFGDINLLFPSFSSDKNYSSDNNEHRQNNLSGHSGMRLWKFSESGGSMQYSMVADTVWTELGNTETIFDDPTGSGKTNCVMSAFYNLKQSNNEPSWKAGDAYGFEIGETQLPYGYIFKQTIPSNVESPSLVDTFVFDGEGTSSDQSIDVWSTKPDSGGNPRPFKRAGRATSDKNATL